MFHTTKAWKTGTVLGVAMSGRSDMYKPDTAPELIKIAASVFPKYPQFVFSSRQQLPR